MAKQTEGFLGGFNGRLGNIVGYRWKGVWCVRTRPGQMRNPRTEKQMEHRAMFKEEVRQASRMASAIGLGLRALADEANMTAHNVFVSLNQQAFSLVDGEFRVDYPTLRLSAGPAAPVAFGEAAVGAGNTLSVGFEKNPDRLTAANAFDYVYLYVYSPELQRGFLSAPVYRRDKRIAVSLPDVFAGHELHLYGMTQNQQGLMSETIYAGSVLLAEAPQSPTGLPDNKNTELPGSQEDTGTIGVPGAIGAIESPESPEKPATAAPEQPTLFDMGGW